MKNSRERFCVDPKGVKLSLRIRSKVLFNVFKKDEDAIIITIIFLIWLMGLGMALCVPPFMIGPISQFIMTFILSLVFGAAFIGIIAGIETFWDEKGGDVYRRMSKEYHEQILPLQKAEMEKVDDILLR